MIKDKINDIKETKKLFRELLKNISKAKIHDFSGIGLVLCDSKFFPRTNHSDLRPSIKCPKGLSIDGEDTLNFLLRISQNSSPCHDGFHFFNEKGLLTHIAQYFWPPIVTEIKPNELYGTRHLSAQYGSCLKGVIAVGVVHSNRDAFYFENGKNYKL